MYKNIKIQTLQKEKKKKQDFTRGTFWEIETLKKRLKRDDKTFKQAPEVILINTNLVRRIKCLKG